ncbi:hypothetical protein LX64_02552 [Chitinophaga skermanii]|uniref:Nucleotidyltransferase n=1 Tax=Chitinophaga skermanii TaxID=331697 RepID=A0A327QNX3_9BACT|nr:nucleotidyltransferase domain-containing protein [Chitinophaga skermanii]RAJ05394.1 hypothetical protein LX64_02552 [Chitinophaga skermanii]
MIQESIQQHLDQLVHDHHITLLYVCESGSRAWGFASEDSDYDVRFIYKQPYETYVSILDRKDVLELPVNEVLDISGWDLRKALQLFLKSNAPLYEWLQSPIIYRQSTSLVEDLRSLMSKYFSERAGLHHYISMANNTFEQHLQGEQVRIKKYYYALRPLLAALWIADKGGVPPMEFGELITQISDQTWLHEAASLTAQKVAANEKSTIAPIAFWQNWIRETIHYCNEKSKSIPPKYNTAEELDALFRQYITA